MSKYNPNNERIKRHYFNFLKEAKRQDESTLDQVAKSLSRFEEHGKYRDFKKFHFNRAVAFKHHLAVQTNKNTGKILSKATINSTLSHLKRFLTTSPMQC